MKLREFKRKHGTRVRVWTIRVEGEAIHTTRSWLGGKAQENVDIPGASSRETALERAQSRANKLIKDKLNKGYSEYDPGTENIIGEEAKNKMDFSGAPPDGFEIFKPKLMPKVGSPEHKKMMDAIDREDSIITKKYDGMKHLLIVTDKGEFRLFTRRMEECSEHYPALMEEFLKFELPNKTLLALELYVRKEDGTEDFTAMQSLSRSLPERARQLQEADPNIIPNAVVLAPVYWGGEPIIKTMTVFDWMNFISYKFKSYTKNSSDRVHIMKMFFRPLESALSYVERRGMEGLVVYDGKVCFGDKAFNFRGKPERVDCWKQKPIYEEDFLAIFDPHGTQKDKFPHGGTFGSGKNMKRPKSLALYQFDSNGQLHYVCNVGTGMDDSVRVRIADHVEVMGNWSGVVSVEYAKRKFLSKGDISNALTFPSFLKIHEDKKPCECINIEL